MPIASVSRDVNLGSLANAALNLPAVSGIQGGYWYYYQANNANNTTLAAAIKPYHWGTELPLLNSATTLTMEGSIPFITESWEGANVKYHGGCVEWVGPGVNDITNTPESDAFFFAHLGALAASDQPFYWDRCFLAEGASEWEYYKYHEHFPNVYEDFDNGRIVFSGGGFIVPTDKAFGYTIDNAVSVMGTGYTAVLARVHTPSVGGAHNSHNDINLPSTQNKNYLMGGIMKGNSDRYHAFYLTANGGQWDVFVRTYVDSAASFTSEVNLGTYDLADPTFDPVTTTGTQSQYPVRASCGKVLGIRIYLPVIYNNATSGFDLKIWSFTSLDTIAGGSIQVTTILTGVAVRPDCHLTVVSEKLYAAVTNVAGGGVTMYSFDTGTQAWTSEGTIVTNSNSNYVRVHGFGYNPADAKFYTLLSGTSSGGASTYLGPGMYSFELTGTFTGYKHLDYDAANTTFVVRNALSNGYLRYDVTDATLNRSGNQEPQAIAEGTKILTYQSPSPKFFNKHQVITGGDSYYYQGIQLKDGRKLLVGRVEGNEDSPGKSDLLMTFVSDDNETQQHFAWGGAGDDYATSVHQSAYDDTVWITGYTKSELTNKANIKLHGYARNLSDGSNDIQWVDIDTDSTGNIYVVGNHSSNCIVAAKYDYDYNLIWQQNLDAGANVDTAYGLAVDGSNVYICGSTTNGGQGNTDSVLIQITTEGTVGYAKTYGTGNAEYASSICVTNKSGTKYLAISCVNATHTTILVTDTAGTVVEQNQVSSTIINRLRNNVSEPTSGRFIFAGKTTAATSNASFGMCEVSSATGRMIQWTDTYGTGATAFEARDIRNIDAAVAGNGAGYVICGNKGTAAFLLKTSVNESAGTYTRSKSWARDIDSAQLNGLVTTVYSAATKSIYVTGYTTAGTQALEDCFMAEYNSSGTIQWQNNFGHTADERFVAITEDKTRDNLLAVGWSESHAFGKNGILFRFDKSGFGTGVYHLEENASMGYYYERSLLSESSEASALTNASAPSNVTGALTAATLSGMTSTAGAYTPTNYDGSYGANGLWMLFIARIDLDAVQSHFNSVEHRSKEHEHAEYTDGIFTFYQVGTVGDGTVDDGNIFGYDIIARTNGVLVVAAQTSGDVADINEGASGAYDYLIVSFDPSTEDFEYYQNTGPLDEEIYALTELANGKIAFTGRTAGTLGGNTAGGYDIFLGIYDPSNDTFTYHTTGSGFEDRGVNVHDLGGNVLAVTFLTQGVLGDGESQGSDDIGIIKFNYGTNTWGTAYQAGSGTSELFDQNGKPSVLLPDGRIAIVGYTAGIFADDATVYGATDIFVGIVDSSTGVWEKYQTGSGAADFGSSVFATGDKLLIAGYTNALFAEEHTAGIFVEFDILRGIGAKSSA